MKVLVVGSGGREHALCWKLAQSPLLERLYCAPGSPGTATIARNVDLRADDIAGLREFAREEAIDLTVVGPEVPLTLGIVDAFREEGLAVFGPDRHAAQLEGSKAFAKRFMERHGIATAPFEVVSSESEAREAASRFGLPVVLKADGLAAGKGVLIPTDEDELEEALATLFRERRFGDAADSVVVEACLVGEEVSLIAISDGRRVERCATAKDYKRIGEGDTGPNTGGMGSHSPSGVLDEDEAGRLEAAVLQPVLDGLHADGHPFIGVLYAGLMMTADGPQVLEYNVRFGDPECQPLMLRLRGDLLPVLAAAAAGDFGSTRLEFDDGASACIVLASEGYPGTPATGAVIGGLDAAGEGEAIFHAGTKADSEGRVLVAGGRVINACARGADLEAALARAYALADKVSWEGRTLRRDIGRRVLA